MCVEHKKSGDRKRDEKFEFILDDVGLLPRLFFFFDTYKKHEFTAINSPIKILQKKKKMRETIDAILLILYNVQNQTD